MARSSVRAHGPTESQRVKARLGVALALVPALAGCVSYEPAPVDVSDVLTQLRARAWESSLDNDRAQSEGAGPDQLAAFGIEHRVECNQGGKGGPVARLVAEYGHPVTVFVDDLAVHHQSVADHAPGVFRLHMISEPDLAQHVPPAPAAHARIDDWREAADWIAARFAEGLTADGERVRAEA